MGKHGWGYLFIWTCAEKGHVYGFHLISGSEGRKDPFSSVFQYMESPPEHIYYDFGCSLSDYCLNRKSTQFWIDEFHGHNHVCGDNHTLEVLKEFLILTHPSVSSLTATSQISNTFVTAKLNDISVSIYSPLSIFGTRGKQRLTSSGELLS